MTPEGAAFAPTFVTRRYKRRDLSNWHDNPRHKPSWERHQEEALVTSAKKPDEGAKRHSDGFPQGSPYWQISEYTKENLNAIREADKLDPDLAEYFKDSLED